MALDWSRLEQPEHASRGWLLAGGLNPGNVQQALGKCQPTAVDVSSGVCGPDGESVVVGCCETIQECWLSFHVTNNSYFAVHLVISEFSLWLVSCVPEDTFVCAQVFRHLPGHSRVEEPPTLAFISL